MALSGEEEMHNEGYNSGRKAGLKEAGAEVERMRGEVRRAIGILDRNLYHQREKCEDALAILRRICT